jgi:hypothetical protein
MCGCGQNKKPKDCLKKKYETKSKPIGGIK